MKTLFRSFLQGKESYTRSLLHKALSGPPHRPFKWPWAVSGPADKLRAAARSIGDFDEVEQGQRLTHAVLRLPTLNAEEDEELVPATRTGETTRQAATRARAAPAPIDDPAFTDDWDDDVAFDRASSFETEAATLAVAAGAEARDPYAAQAAAEEAGLRAAFVRHFRRAATGAKPLDGKELIREAMADCSEGGNFQTSMPTYSVYCTRWASAFHLVFFLMTANKLLGCVRLLLHDRKCEGTHFRFTALELRGGPLEAPTAPGVADFGLLYRGCGLGGANVSAAGASLVASFPEAVGVNGWWFTTAHQPAALDPVRFSLEASRNGTAWELCGASRLAAVPSLGEVAWLGWRVAAHDTTLARGAVETFSLELPWQFALDHVLVMLTHSALNLWVIVELWLRRPMSAHRTNHLIVICCAALYLASALAYALQGNLAVAAIPSAYFLHFSWISYALSSTSSFTAFQKICAAGFFAAGVVQYLVVFSGVDGTRTVIDGYRAALPLDVKTAFSATFTSSLGYLWARRGVARSVAAARALITSNLLEYGAAWAAYLASPDDSRALEAVDKLVRTAWGSLRPAVLRQRHCPPDPRQWRSAPPIRSFERIFAQAAVATPLLRSKAKEWALRSGGMFPMQPADDEGRAAGERPGACCFERWDRVAGDAERMGRVRWVKAKSRKRAVEKVYRCYAGDASRLVDCCRSAPPGSRPPLSRSLHCLPSPTFCTGLALSALPALSLYSPCPHRHRCVDDCSPARLQQVRGPESKPPHSGPPDTAAGEPVRIPARRV